MGAFAPGYKELGDYFKKMQKDMESRADEYGFLGGSDWIAHGERPTGNHLLTVMYFKSAEGIHKWAHDPMHREGWAWWNKNVEKFSHLSIYHEIFVAPKGHWETIYINSDPMLMAGVTVPLKKKDGAVKWTSPIVDASRGLLKSSRGRMMLSDGSDNDVYKDDPYQKA
jgi:heme-degrading monooxygenase HmoA